MAFNYEQQEMELLMREYRLTLETSQDRTFSIPSMDLLNRDKCLEYLTKTGEIFEAETLMANASLFGKRYSYLVVASSLYAMSVFDKGLDYCLENCHIESERQGHAWLPKARLANMEVTSPQPNARQQWRDGVINHIFEHNLSRVWDAISRFVPMSKAVLWENTAIYVFWLYENKFLEGLQEEQQARLREDLSYLVQAPAHLFGEKKNPLATFYGPKVATVGSEKPIRIRKTCCYYYQASDEPEDYCSSCPKIKHELIPESVI
ncbi:IucA/IucC family C-terminal-domain containing protein [Paenibacillus herberti]|nr:IucA/IucC family C-terminal-domain containing protein [Paenibacillus herberti]